MMLLEMATQGFGDRVAFTNREDSLTYQELFDASCAAAAQIKKSGCAQVAMLDVSSLAVPIALFASAWAGVPYVPINYRLTTDEINALLDRVKPCILITSADRVEDFSAQVEVQAVSREEFISRARAGSVLEEPWSMDQEDTGIVLFTSGTTGAPKAAILRQKHLVSYILGSVEFMSATQDDALLSCVPPYHIAGISAILSSVYAGRRVVQLPDFTAREWISLVSREKITTAFVVPTMLARIVEAIDDGLSMEMPDIRALAYGGGKMPLCVIERAMQLFPGVDFVNAYGLTETSSTITILGPQDHRDAAVSKDKAVRRRLVSVGRALPGIELEIRDYEGKVVATDGHGEIYVRGEQVSGEYLGSNSLLDKEGWFPTRDAGSIDKEGFLFLDGRIDDVIVRGGENLSPGEIENVLLEHEAVADVAVVGVADELWGEVVAAAVVLETGKSAGVAELQDWVKCTMRSSRAPQLIQFLDELPYNEMGKLLRRAVKAKLSH